MPADQRQRHGGAHTSAIPWQAVGRLAFSFCCGYGVPSCTAINFSYFITPSNITNDPHLHQYRSVPRNLRLSDSRGHPNTRPRDNSRVFHQPARCLHDFTTFQLSRNFNCTLFTLVFLTHTCHTGHHVAKRTTMGPGSLFRLLLRRYRH